MTLRIYMTKDYHKDGLPYETERKICVWLSKAIQKKKEFTEAELVQMLVEWGIISNYCEAFEDE